MARTIITTKYTTFEGLQDRLFSLLQSKGYKNITENNENVWKCGVGFWTAIKYIKIEFAENNTLLISGWIRPMAGSEQDLNGIIGALPKKQVINVIRELQELAK